MATCFVIQPFDRGKFDKRFDDVFAPAIKAAGFEPYRVDQDPKVEVPIDAIESGISAAAVCLADISTDNPNVWYELGFAFASGKPVVMVCSDERTDRKYPFDIQHRTILPYVPHSTQDFEKLKAEITARVQALANSREAMRQLAQSEQVAGVGGISQTELVVLASIAGARGISLTSAQHEVERAGLTQMGFNLGLRRLRKKNFIETHNVLERDGEYEAVNVTDAGWDWIEGHEGLFLLRKPPTDDDVEDGLHDPPF